MLIFVFYSVFFRNTANESWNLDTAPFHFTSCLCLQPNAFLSLYIMSLYYNAFAQTSTMANHEREMAESLAQTKRISRTCTELLMNSTVQDNQVGAKSRAAMSCELSTINNSLMPLKLVTDTPAKVFARLKAKVQRQNSEELRQVNVISRQLGRSVYLSKNMQQPPVDGATSEQQDIYVLTLSPPKSTSNISELEDPQMTSQLNSEGDFTDLVNNIISLWWKYFAWFLLCIN